MFKHINTNLKHSLLYGASIALMKGVSLLMMPFIAHQLSPEQFGQLEVISTLAIIGSILVGMGMEGALFRFAGTANTQQERKKIASDIFSLTMIVGSLAACFVCLGADYIARLIPSQPTEYQVQLVLLMLALEGCIAIPLAWLRMNDRAVNFFMATTGRALLQALLVLIFLSMEKGVDGILEAGLVAAVLQSLILTYWHVSDTGLHFTRGTIQQCFIYSLPLVASGLVAFVLNGLDRWILAEYASLVDVAQFAVAAKFALATVLLMQPFSMWWGPKRFAILNQPNGQKNVVKFVVLGTTLALFISVMIGIASPLLVQTLLPSSYLVAGQYAVALVIVMLLRELVELFNIGCFIGETTKAQFMINALSALIGGGLMLWLTPQYQAWGIIYALLIAQGTRFIMFYHVSQYFLALHYPLRRIAILFALATTCLILGGQATTMMQSMIIMFLTAICFTVMAYSLKLIDFSLLFNTKALNNKVM
jgi:O-antigen/teichoic acid export membrane protein